MLIGEGAGRGRVGTPLGRLSSFFLVLFSQHLLLIGCLFPYILILLERFANFPAGSSGGAIGCCAGFPKLSWRFSSCCRPCGCSAVRFPAVPNSRGDHSHRLCVGASACAPVPPRP